MGILTQNAVIKALIFDFEGVLIRTEDYGPRHAWDERLGLPAGNVERAVHHSDLWIQVQLGRISDAAYWRGVAELLYMRGDDINELRRDYFSCDRLNYRLLDYIRELRGAGYATALLCNESLRFEDRLRSLGIRDLFDPVIVSAMIGVMKPDPTAYRVTLQELQVAPHEAVFVDDSLAHVRGAQAVGLHAILFRPDTNLRDDLKPYLDGTIT
ncbi:MAG: HAD family phosphatase [Anaerolineae bacterium]|nr:HAD family phosphatase [Anaerolineae bacterium]